MSEKYKIRDQDRLPSGSDQVFFLANYAVPGDEGKAGSIFLLERWLE